MLKLRLTLKHSRQLLGHNGVQRSVGGPFAFQQGYRHFALFQGGAQKKVGANNQQNPSAFEGSQFASQDTGSGAQARSQEEIQRHIDSLKKGIRNKTQQGYALAHSLAQQVEPEKFKKIQRYEIFISKMQQLYKNELRFAQKQRKKFQLQKNAILYSLTPLKDILKAYNDLTTRGFNSEATITTLQNLQNTLRARGFNGRSQGDYTVSELDQSYKMQKLVDDIKFGLRRDQYFNPQHLAQASQQLGDLGYKNTSLIPLFFDKLNTMADERYSGHKNEPTELRMEDAVYGGQKNFIPRHYVFKGFQNSEEFNEYLSILMLWEKEPSKSCKKSKDAQTAEIDDLERTMMDVMNAAKNVKELQKDFQASIDNIRQQYFLMLEAADKHSFIKENEYIKYDLLELQEMLVKGGYLEPAEASQHLAQEAFEDRMTRAADVFYDYVLNYAPELVSPQHNQFYEAAVKSQPQMDAAEQERYQKENFNDLTIGTMSQTLIGLHNQVLSFRRDAEDKDYLNKFYEQYLMPLEHQPNNQTIKGLEKFKSEYVEMERTYLRAWQIFKHETANLLPKFKELVKDDKANVEGQLYALNALAISKFDEPQLRSEIVKNALAGITQSGKPGHLSTSSIVAGLRGLALSSTVDDKGRELAKQISSKLEPATMTFAQQVDALWSMCALQNYEGKSFSKLYQTINGLNFDRIDRDLKYEEFQKLNDIKNALKLEYNQQFTNTSLLLGLSLDNTLLGVRFQEESTKYDPFKQRVVQALAKGLTQASIEHQVINEEYVTQAQHLDSDVLNVEKYPYKPDLVMGYKGQKVGVFVLPETESFRDSHLADGATKFRLRLLERANPTLKAASFAVDQVVDVDISQLKVQLNRDFKLQNVLEQQIQFQTNKDGDFSNLANFGAKFTSQVTSYALNLQQHQLEKLDSFVKHLYKIMQLRHENSLRFEPLQRQQGFSEIRFNLMKLSLLFDSLPTDQQSLVSSLLPSESDSFTSLLQQTAASLPSFDSTLNPHSPKDLSTQWLGTRQEVEMPNTLNSSVQKSIVPEMINQRFMWVEDYFHYDDWKIKQQQVFDNFNLLVIPPVEDGPKFFYDRVNHNRRIPMGVFPNPNHKRQLMLPSVNKAALELTRNPNHDELVLFEKEPYKMMVLKELQKGESLAPIDSDTSMITNLQNVKQGLKSDYSDKEILTIVLQNLNFTEQLIEEHLNLKKSAQKVGDAKYVPRDPSKFRSFVEQTYYSKDREDPFSHFFLKESTKKETIIKMMEDEKEVQKLTEEGSADTALLEKSDKRRQALQDKIDKILLSEEMLNEDLLNMSSSLKQNIKVNYDLKTLVKSEFVYDVDPDLVDQTMSDAEYLALTRRRAESKLIKSKILYKLYQTGEDLSNNEKKYLKQWVSDIKQGKNTNLNNIRDTLLPENHTSLKIGDIEAKNLYTLNSIARVQFDRDAHGQYSLSDLIVEVSHFLDEEVVNKVETEIFSDRLRKEWGLGNDFKVIETRNKEISHVLNELEEVAWRSAGTLDSKDFDYLKRMLSIKRNKDTFDKDYYTQDMDSFKLFFDEANNFDDRIGLVERWIVRKEDEYKQRVVRPPAHLKKSDQELYAQIDKPLKRARESLVAKMLLADAHGNPIDKQYKDLTSAELHTISENLCLRLYLFNYDYPAFLPQVVRAVMEHPNLLRSDKDSMEAYTRMFEVDWKGDRALVNKQEFMMTNPIYLEGSNLKQFGEITPEVIRDRIQRACASYVEEAASKLIKNA